MGHGIQLVLGLAIQNRVRPKVYGWIELIRPVIREVGMDCG